MSSLGAPLSWWSSRGARRKTADQFSRTGVLEFVRGTASSHKAWRLPRRNSRVYRATRCTRSARSWWGEARYTHGFAQ